MAGRLDRPLFELLTQTWYNVFMWNKYSSVGAKKARPPIDHKTQIRSLEVISVVFTATPRLIEIHVCQCDKIFHFGDQILKSSRQIGH